MNELIPTAHYSSNRHIQLSIKDKNKIKRFSRRMKEIDPNGSFAMECLRKLN